MTIEKNGKIYIATEYRDKWTVKAAAGKLEVAYDVPKELCRTEDELRDYVRTERMF